MQKPAPGQGPNPRRLQEIGWLSQQPEDFRTRLVSLGSLISKAKGEVVCEIGDKADALYGLEEGLLDMSLNVDGDEIVTLHRAVPGFWVGESALLADTTRGVTLTAAAPSRIFHIHGTALRRHLAENPGDWTYIYRLSHMNLMFVVGVLGEIIVLPPRARVARALLRLADSEGIVSATQEDISLMARMSRSTFRRAFEPLVDRGIVEVTYGGLRLRDPAALEQEE